MPPSAIMNVFYNIRLRFNILNNLSWQIPRMCNIKFVFLTRGSGKRKLAILTRFGFAFFYIFIIITTCASCIGADSGNINNAVYNYTCFYLLPIINNTHWKDKLSFS
jgi:hypothetical protein